MKIMDKKNWGKPIDETLSTELKELTDMTDVINVSIKHGISSSLLKQVRNRRTSMTENSAPAVQELIKKADKKCELLQKQIRKSKNTLKKYLE